MKVRCLYDKLVPIEELKAHPRNRNTHPEVQLERLAKILGYQGWRYPIKCSNRSGFITSGHGRLIAAKRLGWKEVPVNFQDYESEEQEYADVQADNAIASWAELDLSSINTDLADLGPDFDIDMLGIKDFVLEPADKYEDKDADAVPSPGAAYVATGDLFSLGNHRLLCGDSTARDQVDRLMNGEKADMVFTDPPYGIDLIKNKTGRVGGGTKEYRTKEFTQIIGDDKPFDPSHLLGLSGALVLWGGNYFADKLPVGRCWFVWNKNHPVDRTFCGCELAWTNLDRHSKVYDVTWDGWTKEGESGSKVHPSQKPIKLCAEILSEVTNLNSLIIDPYLGSGSTLIACEKTNRKCYGMEIDPIYCGVILDRWAKFTGKDPVREDGKPWSEIKTDDASRSAEG